MVNFFLQLNPDVNAFQRKFVNEVRRCEEMERKLSKWQRTAVIYKKKLKKLFVVISSLMQVGV